MSSFDGLAGRWLALADSGGLAALWLDACFARWLDPGWLLVLGWLVQQL